MSFWWGHSLGWGRKRANDFIFSFSLLNLRSYDTSYTLTFFIMTIFIIIIIFAIVIVLISNTDIIAWHIAELVAFWVIHKMTKISKHSVPVIYPEIRICKLSLSISDRILCLWLNSNHIDKPKVDKLTRVSPSGLVWPPAVFYDLTWPPTDQRTPIWPCLTDWP